MMRRDQLWVSDHANVKHGSLGKAEIHGPAGLPL